MGATGSIQRFTGLKFDLMLHIIQSIRESFNSTIRYCKKPKYGFIFYCFVNISDLSKN